VILAWAPGKSTDDLDEGGDGDRGANAGHSEPLGSAESVCSVYGEDGRLGSPASALRSSRPVWTPDAAVIGAPATSRVIAGLLTARGPLDNEHRVEVRGAYHNMHAGPEKMLAVHPRAREDRSKASNFVIG
jgi:hypothetical protein